MDITSMHVILILAVVCILGIMWTLTRNLKSHPKAAIIIVTAILIFFITGATIIKTFKDYDTYITASQGVLISNITFAIFLDFSVLIIGGLFLYLANQMYLVEQLEEEKIEEARKKAAEKIKDAEEYSAPFKSSIKKNNH